MPAFCFPRRLKTTRRVAANTSVPNAGCIESSRREGTAMVHVLKNSWALMAGMLLLMVGNGLNGTLLGVRGAIEGFDAKTMSFVMSAYFVGFLGGSRMAPGMIRRVGHIRVFAALGSLISAAFILYAAWPDPAAWIAMRLVVGFSFSGIYVVAESWLNDAATNETRGQTLSAYLIMQMIGIVAAQTLLNFADASGYELFVVMSVLVSLSFLPILLSVSPAPVYALTKPMTLSKLFEVSPLGCVGTFLLGSIFSALFGMSPVYATERGMDVSDISVFIAAIYVGGMLWQYPLGWLSDKMDRRVLISGITAAGALVILIALPFTGDFVVVLVLAFVIGGIANPLYSLLIAYTNDYLDNEDMAAASGGLIFISGLGAIAGPVMVGWMMSKFGSDSFFYFLAALMAAIAGYGAFRMTRRSRAEVETTTYHPVNPQASPVAVAVAQEVAVDEAMEEETA
ncbi:MAG: MFS transporter [Paracoccaceae bacterium]